MLGRSAANLYWLSRYVERAENVARLLEVGYRMWLTSGASGAGPDYLTSVLKAAAVDQAFEETGAETQLRDVAQFMLFDRDNPSSVYNCLANARTNAKAVRTEITQDMWSSLNDTWLLYAQVRPHTVLGNQLPAFLQSIKQASQQFRGAMLATLMRTEAYCFSQLGSFVERADNTARILDVKYYVLLPRSDLIGGEMDLQQWTLILRAASAHRAYRHVYHDRYRPWNIADFLILRPELPRSLAFSYDWLTDMVDRLEDIYGEAHDSTRLAHETYDLLKGRSMDDIFQSGLHEFLLAFIGRNADLNSAISIDYNFY